jgi:hypothetical protein
MEITYRLFLLSVSLHLHLGRLFLLPVLFILVVVLVRTGAAKAKVL